MSFVFGDRKSGFGFSIWGPKIWVWCFGGVGIWNMVLSFVFWPIWVWIQIFWVLNFMFIFSKFMAEDPWPKPHGRNPMVEDPWPKPTLTEIWSSLSLNPDGHRGLIWLAHDCVLVYFIDEDWLWILVFLVFCFWSGHVLGFVCFIIIIIIKCFGFC